ncbi:hypothetical protein M0813_18265 [Anaeramoeba flamelloides]|uniref:Uncharacterized protein n=1 Tax=Anaeramoeba flamelloides TaxID=1746091 RepID=A0AAV7YZZ5_9EUKA|nr:hypothetical protein M0812_19556 [Anaeramoeba flamelloides]KAJ6247631.1 hypothetical protein M0813_18265 [Anaeramoeba flamelloides]
MTNEKPKKENSKGNTNRDSKSYAQSFLKDERIQTLLENEKEKVNHYFEEKRIEITDLSVTERKLLDEQIYHLKEQIKRKISVLDNLNNTRDEAITQKRDLFLQNKELQTKIKDLKRRNLFLELQNTKLENQTKKNKKKTKQKNELQTKNTDSNQK